MTPRTNVAISLREMKADSTTIEIPLLLVLAASISRSEMATFSADHALFQAVELRRVIVE